MKLTIGNKTHIFNTPQVMGIVNITPDSFYAKSRQQTVDEMLTTVSRMVEEGAAMVDIGAVSSRPGAVMVSIREEWSRLAPVLGCFRRHFPDIVVSVDTFRSEVVERVFDAIGPFVVNDISAGEDDPRMFGVAARLQLPVVAMHQKEMCGTDVVKEVRDFFTSVLHRAREAGLMQIILDPGFGFAKTMEQNYELLSGLSSLFVFPDVLTLIGLSRKSMIYKPLGITPDEALPATSALHLYALQQGVDILRVHDVAEARQMIQLHVRMQTKI